MSGGIDLTDADPETVLVIRSALPVFTHEDERPERVGTSVLARIDGHHFIVTAAHVVEDVNKATGRLSIVVGAALYSGFTDAFLSTAHGAADDIGLIPLPANTAIFIGKQGGAFLDADMIDESETATERIS
jgi:hypothetical protein